MDYKDTILDKGRKHKGLGQVNDTNIQDNWTLPVNTTDDNTGWYNTSEQLNSYMNSL